ncbi:hypothetical protein PUNSTDRAFT_138622 [Punctularia strigosozonata HHB-11173 SS5]|uniref:Uncharacterized protein n=1 Tax=Punctularia strigosozonata (strain HHB-11173) TaxID=741275 RepID=R7S3Z9_PUNST|nr:uncharacterized protein PUNSTDRAFT_138622 [Punctularia strigosozonata HHB-11173 SS5]EIN04579.1 hypothetical protein PUNSTDRAFT_138622 [Punctularia strigosozonata HHB-11173 SS5]
MRGTLLTLLQVIALAGVAFGGPFPAPRQDPVRARPPSYLGDDDPLLNPSYRRGFRRRATGFSIRLSKSVFRKRHFRSGSESSRSSPPFAFDSPAL